MKFLGKIILGVIVIYFISCGTKTGPTPPEALNLKKLLVEGWTNYGKHNLETAYAKFDTLVSKVRADTGDGYIGLAYTARDLGNNSESHSSDALALSLLNDPIMRVLNERVTIIDSSYWVYTNYPIGFIIDTFVVCEIGKEDGRGTIGSRVNYVIKEIKGNAIRLEADFSPPGPPRVEDKIIITYFTLDTTKAVKGQHLLIYANEIATYYAENKYWEAAGMYRNFELLLNEWNNTFNFTNVYPYLLSDNQAKNELDLMINEYNVKLLAAFAYFHEGFYANSIYIVRDLINDNAWNDPDNPDVSALFNKLIELSN